MDHLLQCRLCLIHTRSTQRSARFSYSLRDTNKQRDEISSSRDSWRSWGIFSVIITRFGISPTSVLELSSFLSFLLYYKYFSFKKKKRKNERKRDFVFSRFYRFIRFLCGHHLVTNFFISTLCFLAFHSASLCFQRHRNEHEAPNIS